MKSTSMKIFAAFIHRNEEGDLISENILSKECFDHWLSSRSSSVKFPVGAFKRTISSHLRAVDGRVPFDADVEESILKKYRQKDKHGYRTDPFAFLKCSDQQRKSFRGCWVRPLPYPFGYHEKQKHRVNQLALREQPQSMSNDQFSRLSSLLKMEVTDFCNLAFAAENSNTPFFAPAIAYLLPKMQAASPYFRKNFLVPVQEEQYFKKLPILRVKVCRSTCNILEICDETIKIFGKLSHLLAFHATSVEFFAGFCFTYDEIEKYGFAWARGTVKINGQLYVCTSFNRKNSEKILEIFFQVDFDSPLYEHPAEKLFL
eukprot:snap_masked-scaffold_28-processed-gene-0.7-mRNA-1 protein AED:1.00 eAED:1.00 QI:0/0/0/0/1/1/2/0/315